MKSELLNFRLENGAQTERSRASSAEYTCSAGLGRGPPREEAAADTEFSVGAHSHREEGQNYSSQLYLRV